MSINHLVGIQEFGIAFPEHYLPIEELAEARGIDVQKLQKGLGLQQMSVCTPNETTPYLAAKAIQDLVNHLISTGEYSDVSAVLQDIDRIYLGTESAIDAAKPTITYALNILESSWQLSLEHIDFLDMTFACIGGVDALHQCADYVRLRPDRKCIVVAADKAVYDDFTGGEYTQGAGAIAFLISNKPKLVSLMGEVGVSVKHDYDFYKPKRYFSKEDIISSLFDRLNINHHEINASKIGSVIANTSTLKKDSLEGWVENFWDLPGSHIPVQREQPVYDGKFSNECFEHRVSGACKSFLQKNGTTDLSEFTQWAFHLPYAYQGRRMAVGLWWDFVASIDENLKSEIELNLPYPQGATASEHQAWLKLLSKSKSYQEFVEGHIAPTDALSSFVGNMYTASVFLALISGIVNATEDLSGKKGLVLAYGSGTKSKVFQVAYSPELNIESLKERIEILFTHRKAINMDQYEVWRRNLGD